MSLHLCMVLICIYLAWHGSFTRKLLKISYDYPLYDNDNRSSAFRDNRRSHATNNTSSLRCLLISIVLQAFNWESHKHNWWSNLEGRVSDIAKSGFTAAWLPPPTQSLSQEGKLVTSLALLFLIQSIVVEKQVWCVFPQVICHKTCTVSTLVMVLSSSWILWFRTWMTTI
jgi:hypothetical protein